MYADRRLGVCFLFVVHPIGVEVSSASPDGRHFELFLWLATLLAMLRPTSTRIPWASFVLAWRSSAGRKCRDSLTPRPGVGRTSGN